MNTGSAFLLIAFMLGLGPDRGPAAPDGGALVGREAHRKATELPPLAVAWAEDLEDTEDDPGLGPAGTPVPGVDPTRLGPAIAATPHALGPPPSPSRYLDLLHLRC